jgi:hypothetical protein
VGLSIKGIVPTFNPKTKSEMANKVIVIVSLILLLLTSNTCKSKNDTSQGDKQSVKAVKVVAGQPSSAAGDLQACSLRRLQAAAEKCIGAGNCDDEVLQLGKLTRIDGYLIDEKERDIILFGIARHDDVPFFLEDFVVALRNAWLKYADLKGNTYYYSNPGCSIDPSPDVLLKLQQTGNLLFNSAEKGKSDLEQWRRVCGEPQAVRILGIPFDTHFSQVMVEADYFMKRLVDGSVNLGIEGFRSLSDLALDKVREDLDKGRKVSMAMQLNRFWFFPGVNDFEDDQGIAAIRNSPVMLLTEAEFLTKRGDMGGTGKADPMAARFADSFSGNYEVIAKKKPLYRELEGLFRFVALAKLMKQMDAPAESGMDFTYFLERFPVKRTVVSKTLPGIGNAKTFSSRQEQQNGYTEFLLWLPSCGGVSIDIEVDRRRITRDQTGTLKALKERIIKAKASSPAAIAWNVPSGSSSIAYLKYKGLTADGKWSFEDEKGAHSLTENELQAYARAGGGGNFIITHEVGTNSEDWEKREHTTGKFAQRFRKAGIAAAGLSVAIASRPAEAAKKLKKPPPSIGRNVDVLFEKRVYDEDTTLRAAIDSYKETGATVASLGSLQDTIKGNLAVIVAPFSKSLAQDLMEKANAGYFQGKAVLLVVCGQEGNPAAHEYYLKTIDELNRQGALLTISFESEIMHKDAAFFLIELRKLIETQGDLPLPEAIKELEKLKTDRIKQLLEKMRHDVRNEISPSNFLRICELEKGKDA